MQSEQIDKLAEALALAQKTMTLPKKNREVTVTTGTNTKYKFEYTTLDALIEHVREPLTANGLWFVQIITHEEAKSFLETTLMHTSGQWLRGRAQINSQPNGRAQEFGSALTYIRRYALSALLGIASEEDDDANTADGNTVNSKADKPQARPAANGNGHTDTALPPLQRPKANGDSGAAAKQWAKDAEETVKHFIRIEDLRAWDEANTKAVTKLHAVDAAAHTRLNNIIAEQFRRLNPLNAG